MEKTAGHPVKSDGDRQMVSQSLIHLIRHMVSPTGRQRDGKSVCQTRRWAGRSFVIIYCQIKQAARRTDR